MNRHHYSVDRNERENQLIKDSFFFSICFWKLAVCLSVQNEHLKVMETWSWALPVCSQQYVYIGMYLKPLWNISSLFMSGKRVEMFHIHPSSCQARGLKCFTFIPLHVKQEGWNVKQTFQMHHKPTFFCSLMVKSKPEWLHPETFIFEAKGYFSCINIDKATKWSLQTEY